MGEILDGIQAIFDFLNSGLFDFVDDMFSSISVWVATWYFKAKIEMLTFAWDLASVLIDQLNISAVISQHWSSLDPELLWFLTRYNIPEALNMVLNAAVTRFILNTM